jgi:hypothetical protein
MENRRNYYRILQVQPGAPVEIIRASYRTLMQRLRAHPDLGGDHWNATLINEAYAVLTDPTKRADYDREFQARMLDARNAADAAGSTQTATAVGRCLFCQAQHRSSPNLHPDAACTACGSPLHRVTVRALATDGQRVNPRLQRRHPLSLYTSWPLARGLAGESRDLSPNGISFVTMELLRPGIVVKLDSEVCRAVIEVTNTRVEADGSNGLWLIGAQFLSVIFSRSRGAFLSARV